MSRFLAALRARLDRWLDEPYPGLDALDQRWREPDPWRDGDTVALDGEYVRDPRLGGVE